MRIPLVRCIVAVAMLSLSSLVPQAFAQPALKPEHQQKIEESLPSKARVAAGKPRKVLIFTHAAGFVHGSIPVGAKAVELLGQKTGAFSSITSNDPASFDDLSGIDAIVMVNTTGDWLNPRTPDAINKLRGQIRDPKFKDLPAAEQEKAKQDLAAAEQAFKPTLDKAKASVEDRRAKILKFLADGGGLVGFHAASDAQYQWPEFGLVIGGYFWGHPWHEKVGITLDDPSHPLLAAFAGKDFEITDEIYQFKDPYSRDNLRILMKLDTSKTNMTKGGINRKDGDFAVSWVRRYGQGRVFYSSLGHREEIYWNPTMLQFYLDGIQFAVGDLPADTLPSAKQK